MASGEYSTRQTEGTATRPAWETGTWRTRATKLSLAGGFLALSAALAVAHQSPATGYELSIYRATPPAFWGGVGAALFVALVAALATGSRRRLRWVALVLAGSAGVAVAALPVLRGYYFVGAGDALTHLGWMKDLAAGVLDPFAFLYPGIHTSSLVLARVAGVPLTLSTQYVVLAFVVAFVVFVPLCARAVAGTDRALAVGTFAAVLLLPVNDVSVHLFAHPTTQAILFTPLLLYLVVRYATRRSARVAPPVGSGTGALLALSSAALVFVHPQMALSVALLLGGVVATQFLVRWRRPDRTLAELRPLYGQTAFLVLVFALWAPRNDRVRGTVSGVLNNLLAGETPANEIAQRGASLAALGGSLPDLFVRLFGPSLLFVVLAGVLGLGALAGRLDERFPRRNALVAALTLGLVPVGVAFTVFFASSVTTQHLRFVGFGMAPVTVLGAVALSAGVGRLEGLLSGTLSRRSAAGVARGVVVVVVATLLPLSAATAFASPIIFQPSPGVSETGYVGYENALESRAGGVPFAGVRAGPERYVHAVYGTTVVERANAPGAAGGTERADVPGMTAGVPESVFAAGNATEYYDVARYVPVTDRDVAREVGLYRGFRYPAAGFRALETSPGVNRVRANGGFRLYLVTPEAGNETAVAGPALTGPAHATAPGDG